MSKILIPFFCCLTPVLLLFLWSALEYGKQEDRRRSFETIMSSLTAWRLLREANRATGSVQENIMKQYHRQRLREMKLLYHHYILYGTAVEIGEAFNQLQEEENAISFLDSQEMNHERCN